LLSREQNVVLGRNTDCECVNGVEKPTKKFVDSYPGGGIFDCPELKNETLGVLERIGRDKIGEAYGDGNGGISYEGRGVADDFSNSVRNKSQREVAKTVCVVKRKMEAYKDAKPSCQTICNNLKKNEIPKQIGNTVNKKTTKATEKKYFLKKEERLENEALKKKSTVRKVVESFFRGGR